MYHRVCVELKRVMCVCMTVIISCGLIGCAALSEEYSRTETEDRKKSAPEVTDSRSDLKSNLEIKEAEIEEEQIKPEKNESSPDTERGRFEEFKELGKNHKILAYDICALPKYDYENTPLADYIEADIVWNEEMSKKEGRLLSLEIDYHLFDFNDDGIEDYLLCESGSLFNGIGNSVDIFIQEKEGIRQVLSMPMILHNSPSDHEKLIILDEKTNGYYAIVPPYKDFILRYDAE